MTSLPVELWIKISLSSPHNESEYTFNYLVRAVPSLGRWAISGHSGEIIGRRLDLMEAFGYDVRFGGIDIGNMYVWTNDARYIVWRKNGVPHRNDGPAIMNTEEYHYFHSISVCQVAWMRHGRLHRGPLNGDGPALEGTDGALDWFINGKSHRDDGPAAMWPQYYITWKENGYRHRDDGPAKILANGGIEWYIRGELHHANGPLVIYSRYPYV